MNRNSFTVALLAVALAVPAVAQPPRSPSRDDNSYSRSLERWVQQLENELEHLQEDLYFERGNYPPGLRDQVEQASQAVAHFHHVLRRSDDRRHLLRDFREMDQQIHQLVNSLNGSGDPWLRRQALRISYADEQLHYTLRMTSDDRQSGFRELLARHAHVLENEANNLEALVDRIDRRDDRMRRVIADFADEAEDFHEAVEEGDDQDELWEDFRELDEKWHRSVEYINQSGYGLYLRRTAQDVNRVHNQIHALLTDSAPHRHVPETRPIDPPRERVEIPRERPGIEIELPRIGRFRIPL